jgi:hypothetical protein
MGSGVSMYIEGRSKSIVMPRKICAALRDDPEILLLAAIVRLAFEDARRSDEQLSTDAREFLDAFVGNEIDLAAAAAGRGAG